MSKTVSTTVLKGTRRIEGHSEMLVWNVPIELKNKFKAECIMKGTTMREELITLMEEYVRA